MTKAERVKIYKRTKLGLISVIYSNQKANAKKRGRKIPNYSKQELKEWLYSQKKFHVLFSKWKNNGYEKNMVPSCDRINDYDDYSLDRLTLTTWAVNNKKHYMDVINGRNLKHCTPVIGIEVSSNKKEIFYSVSSAARKLNINRVGISQCLIGRSETSGGYKWKYQNK